MPGIAALIARGATRADAAALAASLRQLPTEVVTVSVREGAALVHVGLGLGGEEGGLAARGPYLLAVTGAGPGIVGEPLPRADVDAHPRDGGGQLRPLAERLLDRVEARGPEALADLDGIACACLWDERTKTATLANDRLGMARLYFQIANGRLRVSSRATPLAETEDLDLAALGQLLQIGYPLDDRTLHAGVKLLPPASLATWRDGQFLVRRTWEPPPPPLPAATEPDLDEAADRLGAAFGPAVERALDPRLTTVLPISGGLDSRMLLGYARQHVPLVGLSFGHGHSRDLRYGSQLARLSGARHVPILLPADYAARLGPRGVELTEGMVLVESFHFLALNPPLAAQPSLVLSGFLGGVMSGAHVGWVLPEEEALPPASAARALFDRRYRIGFSDEELKRLIRRPFLREVEGAAFESFLATYRRAEGAYASAERVNLELRQRRFVVYQITTLGQTAVVRAPFADRAVIDAVLGLPLAARRAQRAYIRLLVRRFPDLARVPATATGVPLAGPPLLLALQRQLEWCRWRGMSRVTRGLLRPHDYRQYAHYDEWIRTGASAFFAELIADRELLGDLLDLDQVADLWKAHMEYKVDAHARLAAVATLALHRRQIRRRHARAEPPPALAGCWRSAPC
jgi:Glutamine amidotransferase domain/Asparagine synthase